MESNLRHRPPVFRALGRKNPPEEVNVDGQSWMLLEIFKHDSWAATALYGTAQQKIVVKFNRNHPVFGLPMWWLGHWLASRESKAYTVLAGLPGLPAPCGPVCFRGRKCPNAFAHQYLEGHPLAKAERPGTNFFGELEALLLAMHARGLAYMDLNKRENVIVTEHGTPALVDFQIYFKALPWASNWPCMRWLTHHLQAGDLYHLEKLRTYHTLGPEAVAKVPVPRASKLWRMLYVHPVQWLRRRLFVALRIRSGEGLAVSELEPEKAVRLSKNAPPDDMPPPPPHPGIYRSD